MGGQRGIHTCPKDHCSLCEWEEVAFPNVRISITTCSLRYVSQQRHLKSVFTPPPGDPSEVVAAEGGKSAPHTPQSVTNPQVRGAGSAPWAESWGRWGPCLSPPPCVRAHCYFHCQNMPLSNNDNTLLGLCLVPAWIHFSLLTHISKLEFISARTTEKW